MRILLFLIFLTIGLNNEIFAHRTCGSEINLESIKQNDPDRYQRIMQMEKHVANFSNERSLGLLTDHEVITVPVVVHVLHTGQPIGTGLNISEAQIQSQIDVLNEDFRRLNADASNTPVAFQGVASDPEIEFVLACIDPNGNPTNGILRVQTNVNSFTLVENPDGSVNEEATGIKFAPTGSPAWPAERYLNIWVCNLGNDLLGYAQFPDMMATQPETDGAVVRTTSFGRIGNVSAPFDQGRTATHEVGHWLNLWHTWGQGGCGSDDFVIDTPNQFGPNFNCPSHPQVSCSSNDMFMNYMDYTDDGCMNIFTQGQRNRMRALFSGGGVRSSFVDSPYGFTISGPPDPVCPTSLYSIPNLPAGTTVAWSASPAGMVSLSPSGNTVTVTRLSGQNGFVNLIAEINSPGCGSITLEKQIITGISPALIDSIRGPYDFPANTSNNFSVDIIPTITNYHWSVFPSGDEWIGNQGTNGINLSISSPGFYSLGVDITNPCGTAGLETSIYVSGPFEQFNIYPNPASDNLTIENTKGDAMQSNGEVYEVSLYDGAGRELMSFPKTNQKSININVRGLKNGFYYIHIRYKDALIRRQIRVER
ncbi:M43 family zinc metalloprotease [Litoribacter populi]|uniref:M43 family zinc metalloprotease n=1 Tax=Litoribacter populi TaxID=2598460 RepID=UPI00117FFA51|nr:M43 family zinc metalloprotease [Litoribacter populi]